MLRRKADAGAGPDLVARRRSLDAALAALAGHDPERTLARGYALVETEGGDVVTTAEAARRAGDVRIRFADAAVPASIQEKT